MQTSFYAHSFSDLLLNCEQQGLPSRSAGLLFNWHYKKNQRGHLRHQDLAQKARHFFEQNFHFDLPEIEKFQLSPDSTVKFLFRLRDGKKIETVMIPFQNKYTLCLSSQVGCAMSCAFCFTGDQGFTRHLSTEEIIGQFLGAKTWLANHRPGDERILNIVFMGQGEPLHNFEAVKKANEIFLSQHGLSLAPAKITVSTSGYLPGLLRWKKEMPNVNVALSLHAASAEKRAQIIPLQKKYPLTELLPILENIPEGKNRFVTYEYLLLKDFNDSPEDAAAVGELLRGKKAYINLIPFNPYPGGRFQRPSDDRVQAFKNSLMSYDIPITLRTTKGDPILAACGQLAGL